MQVTNINVNKCYSLSLALLVGASLILRHINNHFKYCESISNRMKCRIYKRFKYFRKTAWNITYNKFESIYCSALVIQNYRNCNLHTPIEKGNESVVVLYLLFSAQSSIVRTHENCKYICAPLALHQNS